MNRRICDYCGEPRNLTLIRLHRRPNDNSIAAELCEQCLADIKAYQPPGEAGEVVHITLPSSPPGTVFTVVNSSDTKVTISPAPSSVRVDRIRRPRHV